MLHDVDEEAEPEAETEAEPEAEAAQPEAAQPEAARPGEAKSEEAQSDEDFFRWCIEACSELEGVDSSQSIMLYRINGIDQAKFRLPRQLQKTHAIDLSGSWSSSSTNK